MQVLDCDMPVYFDVDSTLIDYHRSGPEDNRAPIEMSCYGFKTVVYPHYSNIKFLKTTHARGRQVIVWSQQGARWAKEVVLSLGLEACVAVVLTKPIAYVDDLPAHAWMGDPIFFKDGHLPPVTDSMLKET